MRACQRLTKVSTADAISHTVHHHLRLRVCMQQDAAARAVTRQCLGKQLRHMSHDAMSSQNPHLLLKEMRTLLAFCGAYRLPIRRCSSAPLLWPTPCTESPAGARPARGPARSFASVVRNACGTRQGRLAIWVATAHRCMVGGYAYVPVRSNGTSAKHTSSGTTASPHNEASHCSAAASP